MDRAARRALQRHSLRDQVLEALRHALVDGDLEPGQVYSAPVLAERFGVSPTPVREAMQQLVREGAMATVPNKGFQVARRSGADLAELAEVRALIEVPVLLRLARTVPADRWEELRPLATATVERAVTGDRAAYAEADRAFHGALLGLSGNRQLVDVASELHRRAQIPVQRPGPRLSRGADRTTDTAQLVADAAEHAVLLDALIAQQLDTVEALAREHFSGITRSNGGFGGEIDRTGGLDGRSAAG